MEEKSFTENVVEFLKKEESSLRQSMDICLNRGDTAMYKNLINAYEKVVFLIKQYDWELKYSKYTTYGDNGEEIKQISIWEQNGDGLIKNHKAWNIIEDPNEHLHIIPNTGIKLDNATIDEIIKRINERTREAGLSIGDALKEIKNNIE